MNRRRFLQASAATVALTALPHHAAEFADQKKRVGLIGTGWYGKCDLLRLKGKVVGDDEANRLLRRPYRAPWVHPEPGVA